MFQVFTKRNGEPFTHSVKALKIIWNKFPQWYGPNSPIPFGLTIAPAFTIPFILITLGMLIIPYTLMIYPAILQ
jgi:hypothetical protein